MAHRFTARIAHISLVLLTAAAAFSQKPGPTSPAALEEMLASAATDTARLRILEKLGRAHARTDAAASLFWFKKLDSAARLSHSAFYEARAAAHFSFIAGMEGQNQEAIAQARRALHLFDSLGEHKKTQGLVENLSVFLIRDGKFREALRINLHLLLRLEQTGGSDDDLYHTHQRIAVIYGEQRQTADALRHDRLALAAAERMGSTYLRATAIGTIGTDLAQWPDSAARAEQHFREAIALFEKADTCPSCAAQFSGTLAKFYLNRGRPQDAALFIKKGLAFSEQTDDPYAKFEVEMAAAQLAIVEGRPADALPLLKKNEENAEITSNAGAEYERLWAQYLFATGQGAEGYRRLQRAAAMQDSVAAEVFDDGLSEMRVQFETDLLAAQNEGLRTKNNYFAALAMLLGLLLFGGAWSFSRLRRQKRLIEAQNRSLENLNATKDKFFAIIAHDLRGPITSFHGLIKKINWLIARGDTERVGQLGDSVDEAASGLNKLLDNLLAWALVQRGTMPYNPEAVRLREEAEAGVAAFKNSLDTKNISLEMDIDDGFSVFADRAALACFVRNLTDNALKYIPSGSQIRIAARQTDDEICLSVADNGLGMDEAQIAHLLSEKSPDSPAIASKGTGLGLMLCRELAELNKGRLEASSRPGAGTVISIWLPKAA